MDPNAARKIFTSGAYSKQYMIRGSAMYAIPVMHKPAIVDAAH